MIILIIISIIMKMHSGCSKKQTVFQEWPPWKGTGFRFTLELFKKVGVFKHKFDYFISPENDLNTLLSGLFKEENCLAWKAQGVNYMQHERKGISLGLRALRIN